MDLKLKNKTALVTGSTAGIGFGIARTLAAEGARVIVNGRAQARVSEAINSIRAAHPDAALEPLVADLADADWSAIIETNFMSGVRLCRHYLPVMKTAGWGRIIFISSESGINIPAEMIHYGVTKTMQMALARGLAETSA